MNQESETVFIDADTGKRLKCVVRNARTGQPIKNVNRVVLEITDGVANITIEFKEEQPDEQN